MKKKSVIIIAVVVALLALAALPFAMRMIKTAQGMTELRKYEKAAALPYEEIPLSVGQLWSMETGEALTLSDGAVFTRLDANDTYRRLAYEKCFSLDGTEDCEFKAVCCAVLVLSPLDDGTLEVSVPDTETRLVSAPPYNCKWVGQTSGGEVTGKQGNRLYIYGCGYFECDFPFSIYWLSPTLFMNRDYILVP